MTQILAALVALTLASCATPETGPQRWSGRYEWSFETSSFVADGGRENWWVAADNPEAGAALNAAVATPGSPWGSARITVEGSISAPGHYGHLGAYQRELHVTRVISAEPASPRP